MLRESEKEFKTMKNNVTESKIVKKVNNNDSVHEKIPKKVIPQNTRQKTSNHYNKSKIKNHHNHQMRYKQQWAYNKRLHDENSYQYRNTLMEFRCFP